MRKTFCFIVPWIIVLALAVPSFATNGDNLIGIGPSGRAMGGTDYRIARPSPSSSSSSGSSSSRQDLIFRR